MAQRSRIISWAKDQMAHAAAKLTSKIVWVMKKPRIEKRFQKNISLLTFL